MPTRSEICPGSCEPPVAGRCAWCGAPSELLGTREDAGGARLKFHRGWGADVLALLGRSQRAEETPQGGPSAGPARHAGGGRPRRG